MGLSFVCIHYLSSNITYIFQLYICNGSPNLSWYNFLSFIAFNNFTYNTFIVWVSLSPQESWFYSISTNTIEHCPHLNYVKLIFYYTEIYLVSGKAARNNGTEAPKRETPHCFIRNLKNLCKQSWEWQGTWDTGVYSNPKSVSPHSIHPKVHWKRTF